ncbi:hypothetical protein F4805DRAFT_475783 [Annulohypoxylon moriforme]|nr:hypothetical protein F4805DRAFT_475783 [Annulohypoxylon moriforme]
MQFKTIILAALFSGAAIANYNILLYRHRQCLFQVGHVCNNMTMQQCCRAEPGKKYQSARLIGLSGGLSTEQMTLYKDNECHDVAVTQKTGPRCVSHNTKDVQSAAIFGLPKRENAEPATTVEPDEAFMEEGKFRYTIKRDSPEGRAYDHLEEIEDQVEHLRTFGKRVEILEDVE